MYQISAAKVIQKELKEPVATFGDTTPIPKSGCPMQVTLQPKSLKNYVI